MVAPNAVVALKRAKGTFHSSEVISESVFPGFWRMSAKYWRTGWLKFIALSANTRSWGITKLLPEHDSSDLVPGGAGVRTQAVQPVGSLVDDFQFECSTDILHVCNVPSPAATASIPIGKAIVQLCPKLRTVLKARANSGSL